MPTSAGQKVSGASNGSPARSVAAASGPLEYLLDAWQRAILTWDVLRERGNRYLEHEQENKPPVLAFDYEMVVDGRELPNPFSNYALLRIKPGADNPPTDPKKRAFVVIDPRAGHGPGIGGFKMVRSAPPQSASRRRRQRKASVNDVRSTHVQPVSLQTRLSAVPGSARL